MNRQTITTLLVTLLIGGGAYCVGLASADTPMPATSARQDYGPDIIFLPFTDLYTSDSDEQWILVAETPPIAFDDYATVLVDAKVKHQTGAAATFSWEGCEIRRERIGEPETILDTTQIMWDQAKTRLLTAGHASLLEAGSYVYRLYIYGKCDAEMMQVTVQGWLRLILYGCPNGLCIPGDLDKDGDVDLSDFATFALNYTGAQ